MMLENETHSGDFHKIIESIQINLIQTSYCVDHRALSYFYHLGSVLTVVQLEIVLVGCP